MLQIIRFLTAADEVVNGKTDVAVTLNNTDIAAVRLRSAGSVETKKRADNSWVTAARREKPENIPKADESKKGLLLLQKTLLRLAVGKHSF